MTRRKVDRPIGHRSYVRDPAKPPGCATCDETWPCKAWRSWTQSEAYREAEALTTKIRADLGRWKPGLFAAEVAPPPACQCGLSEHYITGNRGYSRYGEPSLVCHRHPEKRGTQ